VWGAIGSEKLLASTSMYQPLVWFFVGGAAVTLLFYLLFRLFPNLGFFEYVHWPIIFESAGSTADGNSNALLSTTIFAFVFQYFLRKFRRHWYDVFNYSISAALDTGTLIAAFFIYVCLKLPRIAEKYGYNAVNPDPFVWDTPEYCYNITALP
jgi:hypothetical protein